MLNDNRSDLREAARNQYAAFLERFDKVYLLALAETEHKLQIVPDAPKRIIIQKILDSKYGGQK